jgi:N-methylhydantoinase B/oxoprolinase/acetone carboxylase alpha subunit
LFRSPEICRRYFRRDQKPLNGFSRVQGSDGDQFFFNDPYIAKAHTFDMMIIKPVFTATGSWRVSSSIHTADTGGVCAVR